MIPGVPNDSLSWAHPQHCSETSYSDGRGTVLSDGDVKPCGQMTYGPRPTDSHECHKDLICDIFSQTFPKSN